MIARDLQDVRLRRCEDLQQPVNLLPQRRPRLLLGPPAPEQFGEAAAQGRPRSRQRDGGEERAGFASGRKFLDALKPDARGCLLALSNSDTPAVRELYQGFDVATIIYSRFRSVISQVPTVQQLIPAALPEGAAAATQHYEYEPDEGEILSELLPRNVTIQIFRALLENVAGEFGAKMSAMDAATRNAGDVIDRLTLQYNRTRQAMITKELIEIISGAEAL